MVRRRKIMDEDSIGDLRVSYRISNVFSTGAEVSVLGNVREDNKVMPLDDLTRCISTKKYSARDFIESAVYLPGAFCI